MFPEHCTLSNGATEFLLTGTGAHIVSKLLATHRGFLEKKHVTLTSYHPQTNVQIDRYKKAIVGRLRHNVLKHQDSWGVFVQPLK